MYALLPLKEKMTQVRVNSYSQIISVEVQEKTWDEWLKTIGDDVGQLKAIFVAIAGAGTAVLGWFGLNHTRRRPVVISRKNHRFPKKTEVYDPITRAFPSLCKISRIG